MALLIDGPKSLKNDIDVYLQPLIDELKVLWEVGIKTYDADTQSFLQMRAAVLWTISDFAAYGMLSGWSTKGYKAYPTCHVKTGSTFLLCSKKCVYMRHRRFLPDGHPWRIDKKGFDGKEEHDCAPTPLSGEDILKHWEGYDNVLFGKVSKGLTQRGRNQRNQLPEGWKKRSIFFELPYWQSLLIRHNFDVMHVEKNVCDNILNTILQKDGKSKDNIKARLDLQKLNIRKPLHPKPSKKVVGKVIIPHASYNMSKEENKRFLQVLKDLKLPEGFSSNIANLVQVQEMKIVGLKSHDCHVLMQQLLPLALRRLISKPVGKILNEYCFFFREICAKVIHIKTLERLERAIPFLLCKLEKIFPPAFFDIMVHLTIHLATEARLAGPVQYKWMYPVERYLLTLKNYVRNKNRPEGSIAEGYLMEEATTFCAQYIDGVGTKLTRRIRYEDGPIGAAVPYLISAKELYQVHRFLLFNTPSIQPYITEHQNFLKHLHPQWSERRVRREQHTQFVQWFRAHVDNLRMQMVIGEEVRSLARGPKHDAHLYQGFFVNGYKFDTVAIDKLRVTQNSGVTTIGEVEQIYYGVLESVIKVYIGCLKPICLFKCHWYDMKDRIGRIVDEHGFTMLNVTKRSFEDEPFIFPCQAQQVFYSKDPIMPDWYVICRWKPRDTYEVPIVDVTDDVIGGNEMSHGHDLEVPDVNEINTNEDITWVREDLGVGVWVDKNDINL